MTEVLKAAAVVAAIAQLVAVVQGQWAEAAYFLVAMWVLYSLIREPD